MIHKCWWERFQSVKTTKTDAAGWFCIKVFGTPWRGATTAAGPITSNNNRFCPMFFGPRESRPSSHHTRLLPCFFLVPTFHSANEPPCFCWVRPKHPGCLDVLTFIRRWHLQFHWRNELPKMLVSKVPNLSLSHSSLPISILLLSSLALP